MVRLRDWYSRFGPRSTEPLPAPITTEEVMRAHGAAPLTLLSGNRQIAALLAALTLAGCATPAVRLAVPPGWQDHAAQVAKPVIPQATTPCAFDPTALCNSDEETGRALGDYDAALAEANRKLQWFYDFFGTVPKPKP